MSFEFYSKWWAGTKENLERLRQEDEQFVAATDKKIKDRSLASQLVGGLYAKYCVVVQDLGTILDQMVQPQKRIIARKLMDAATIRLHEFNEEMRNIDISEYHYVDGTLIELKLVPQSIEILEPSMYYLREYTLEELWTKIKNGETIYTPPPPPPDPNEEQPDEVEAPPEEEEEAKAKKRPKRYVPEEKILTPEEIEAAKRTEEIERVVTIIQTSERGRQARIYFLEKEEQYSYRKQIRLGVQPTEIDPEAQEKACNDIPRYWRGYSDREMIKRKERERRFLIGMYETSWKSNEEFEKLERNLEKRRELRDLRIKEYCEAIVNERTRVFKVIAPRLMEDIGDEIREWFHEWYTEVKNFDTYPPEAVGGTVLVVRGETMTPKEYAEGAKNKAKATDKDKAKLKAEKAKLKKQLAKQKKKEKERLKQERLRKKKKKLTPWAFELEYEPTTTKEPFDKAFEEYYDIFTDRKDEDNPSEKHYMDIIHEDKCYEMQLEVREIVDDLMRIELEMLKDALARDKKGKKRKKKKKKKKKKRRKKKGKKKKKDMTSNRSTEDLFQELVDNGIIHPYEKRYLREFKGDFSYKNWELRMRDVDPPACLGDVRQAVKLSCVAPLSTTSMNKPRSVLLLGPRQSGKHLLANAVFTESQSVLFDLSPEVIAGKYAGGKGMKMLLHLVNKMARLLQPSVIYFEAAEKIFYKKVPKDEKDLEPKRIGKKVQKAIVKKIKPEDRILVFGICGRPWMAKPAKLKKCFEKVILMPRPDYGSVYLYWKELLMSYHGVDRNIDVSCLAGLTVNYPLPVIREVVEKVLTAKRIIQLSYNPLHQSELHEEFLTIQPITDKEYKKFLKFYGRTPLAKERKRLNKYNEKKRQDPRAKKKQATNVKRK